MDIKDLVAQSNTQVIGSQSGYSVTRAKSFQVKTSPHNYVQYVKTVKAYALAGMSFEHIANAGDYLGDEVERNEVDAPLQNSRQSKIGEVVEDAQGILAWQNRGERVSITHQLSSTATSTGKEVVVISQDLITTEATQDQTIDVLEGIKVERKKRLLTSLD